MNNDNKSAEHECARDKRKLDERVVRWQSTTMVQLGYAINLILSFSVATLGFQLSLLQNAKFNTESCAKCLFIASLIFLCISIVFGICLVINRLRDFRITTKIARKNKKMHDDGKLENERNQILSAERFYVAKIGKCSWVLFGWQIGTFGAGILLTVASILSEFYQRIF